MLRLKLGFVSMFSPNSTRRSGWLPWIFFTISFGDCWFILLGNHAILSPATFLIELWEVLVQFLVESVPLALDGPFEVGQRHFVCPPARLRLNLAWWHGTFPAWRGASARSGLEFLEKLAGPSRLISRILCVFPGSRPEPALFAFR